MPFPRSFILLATCLLLFIATFSYLRQDWTGYNVPQGGAREVIAAAKPRPAFHAPSKNVWTELTEEEASSVYDFATANAHLFGGSEDEPLQIAYLEAIRPNKSDVTAYLTREGDEPLRWAKAVVPQIIDGYSYLNYFAIGPLPVSEGTTIQPLTWPFKDGRYGIRSPLVSFEEISRFAMTTAKNASDITLELLGDYVRDDSPDVKTEGLRVNVRTTYMAEDVAYMWFGMMRPGTHSSAWSILPQGLFFKARFSSHNTTAPEIVAWYYNGVYYEGADGLRAEMKKPGFVRCASNQDGDWTTIEDLEDNEERAAPPPVMVQPYGPRYKLDREQQYVSYMGWTFYFTSYISGGTFLYDVRFRNESVMYELGLNEALSHYAGDDPLQGGQEFLDAAFGMGRLSFQLVPGYDCPAYADYVDLDFHFGGKKWSNKNAICIFEYTADHLLQRHSSQSQVTVSKNNYLILRFVSTVGNYDYTIEYIMYLDGTLEVKVRASGFIFAAFFSNTTSSDKGPDHPPGAEADKYGYRINDAVSSSMHDHVLSFKADVDIAGSANVFHRVAIEPSVRSYSWEQPEIPERNTMRLHDVPLSHEAGLNWPPNSGEMFLISHASKLNHWSERRSYRITPGTGMGTPPHLTIQNSTSLGSSARWAEHDLWILKHHDEERACADPLNWFSPLSPVLDFSDLADDEPLDTGEGGEDVVLYFNLGAHHVPHSSDLPNTLMHTSASSVAFVPHNFFDRDVSRKTVSGVRLGLKGGNGGAWVLGKQHQGQPVRRGGDEEKEEQQVTSIKFFGGRYEGGVKLGKEEVEPDLEGYGRGDVKADIVLSPEGTIFGAM